MPLQIASLNSGSNGNSYYIGNESEAVLIDAGLSCRETERRMAGLGLNKERVKAIFISHEHTDHIVGVAGISRRWEIPVYITPATLANSRMAPDPSWVISLERTDPVFIGGLQVFPFPKFHDAQHPHSFVVSDGRTNIGIFTDLGRVCKQLEHYFGLCHAAFLEANYDTDLLEQGKYPAMLKKRISGGFGHLSNNEALDLFLKTGDPSLSLLILSHLSKENNHPDLVRELFKKHAQHTEIFVASRYEASPVFVVDGASAAKEMIPFPKNVTGSQLALF